jgi:beta-lactamase superfamily II metal-dependent hydrolase
MNGAAGAAAERQIRVRMYRVGFGDCFLVTFPGSQHVLIDCGVHARGNIGTLDQVLDDIVAETGGRLAIIVVSHAHEDHIAGFVKRADLFRTFQIGEIWLPWSEDPTDGQARELRRSQAALFDQLTQHFAASPPSAAVADVMANAAVSRNAQALDNLRAGFGTGAKVTFHQKGDSLEGPGGIAGLSVRFLGPPKDPDFLKRMDPPKLERYLRLGASGSRSWTDDVRPFDEYVRRDEARGPVLTVTQERALKRAVESSPDALAFALDSALNNTSLVCLFSYGGRSLLFAGDAQFGNWQAWLADEDAAELLRHVSFYKVAHHGSENATPKTALEAMATGEFAAMMSTQSLPWPSIPYGKLELALRRQTNRRVIRSDTIAVVGAPAGPDGGRLPRGFKKGRLWIDYVLPF